MIKLSERLKCAASFVEKNAVIADVGCDHGLLSLYLLERDTASFSYLMDLNPGPLSKAAENSRLYALSEKTETLLSDGLTALPGHDPLPDTVIIAGMGGRLTENIIAGAPAEVRERVGHWILSPQSELSDFRKALEGLGLMINDEKIVKDQGKYYFVISAGPEEQDTDRESRKKPDSKYDEALYLYGEHNISRKDPLLKELLMRDMSLALSLLEKKDIPEDRRRELNKKLDIMKGVYSGFEMP